MYAIVQGKLLAIFKRNKTIRGVEFMNVRDASRH